MGQLTDNKQIDYIAKDFQSTIDALITFATVNFGNGTSSNRLWTNFNIDSFSRNWLEIVAFVADSLYFYFDTQATESFLQTATLKSSVNNIAKQFGFTPAGATSASGTATFVVDNTVTFPFTIPKGSIFTASNGEDFFLTNDVVASVAGEVSGTVLQGTVKVEQFTAEGLQDEEVQLQGPNVIIDSNAPNPTFNSPIVTVNGNTYYLVNSFIRHDGTDSDPIFDSLGNIIGGGGRVFTLDEKPDGTPFIRFGDGIFGRKLSPGETITVNYRTGGGSAGNIAKQTLNTVTSAPAGVVSVTNNEDFSGGADEQSIDQLRELIPASLRTLERAVAEQDYSDILKTNFSEVFTASTEVNNEDLGTDLNIYVVPQGTGIPQISSNLTLKSKLENFIDRRKMVTVQFKILDAFGVNILIDLEVFITDTSSRTTVTQSIQTAIQEFFNLVTGGESGSGIDFAEHILLKDISNIISNIDGVERFEIKKLSYRPRIDKQIVGLTTTYNASDVTIFPPVTESEWLFGASGKETRVAGNTLFDNTGLVGFTYTASTGVIQYLFPVDLRKVAAGDTFIDGANQQFSILGVNTKNNTLILDKNLTVDTNVVASNHGSVISGATIFEGFTAFRKLKAKATNLSIDSITDNNIDLTVKTGTANIISSNLILDNTNVFIPNEFSTGKFLLVDSAGHIWDILENDSSTIKTSLSAIDDASIVSVAPGSYNIVHKLTGNQIVFQDSTFNIQYNNTNTVFSTGGQFSQIGTIGDSFDISLKQNNKGNLGIALDLISYDASTGEIRLNGIPDLKGVNSDYILVDSSGQLSNVIGTNNVSQSVVFYDEVNRNSDYILTDTGLGSIVGQGFKVPTTDIYTIISLNLRKEGNILGNLTAKIVADDGTGLPDNNTIIATSQPVSISSISETDSKTVFNFTSPPTLTAGTQYHIILQSDSAYANSFKNNITVFDNTGLVAFTYDSLNHSINYTGAVNLSNVLSGNFFKDMNGDLFKITSVDDAANKLIIDDSTSAPQAGTPTSSSQGSVIVNDRVVVGVDASGSPSYLDGEFSQFDGITWSNSTSGSNPLPQLTVGIFSVEGTKTIVVDTNLTPTLGPGATISTRYFDDESQISVVLGISKGSITFASDLNPNGVGTVSTVPNRPVDRFIFRTSRFTDDIVNLRLNEIPQLDLNDLNIKIFGGIE